jgi:hypothetical protein
MREASRLFTAVFSMFLAQMRQLPPPKLSTSAPKSATRSRMIAHVFDFGQIVQGDRLVGEQAGGEQFEGGVFVAAGGDGSVEGMPP